MKKFRGRVVSTKMAKTAVIEVERYRIHPLYKKRMKIKKKYHVHDDLGVREGEEVIFGETRPISKTKRWKIIERVGVKKENDSIKK
jgi:small subunit ribosomal protein S17